MKQSIKAVSAASFAFVLAAPAIGQVTPEEVWQNWQKMGASYGQAIIADSVVRDGETLVVSGMQISMDQDGAKISGGIEEIRFKDQGDGTVEVTMTDTYAIDLTMPGENDTVQEIAIVLTQPGVTLIAGGNASRTDYTYTAPSIMVDMQIKEDGAILADVDSTLTTLSGTYTLDMQAAASVLNSAMTIEKVDFALTAGDAQSGANAKGSLSALKLTSNGNFLGIDALEDMAQALRSGFTADLDFSYGQGDITIDATDSGKATKVSVTNQSGHFKAAMAEDALRYGAGGTGVALTVSGADIPFPEVKVSYGEASFDFLMPLLATQEPTDFTFLMRIVDLAVSDEIWSIFDPTTTLSRDPSTLVIDTKGKVLLNADLLNEEAMAAMGNDSPGEIHALDLTNLTLKFAGAEVIGAGNMTFDNSDVTTFDGIPAPTGKIDMVIRGGNGLLDKLVAMGMIPQDQAMGARMMMAMFAKPGDGPDVLNSSLEFRDKGFFANGQRLK